MIGFIGAGKMGGSLIHGLLKQHSPQSIKVCDQSASILQPFQDELSLAVTHDPQALAQQCDTIVLAVKPQTLKEVVTQIATIVRQRKCLLISIAAGITTPQIQRWLESTQVPIIRAMPNTPALVQAGITALFATPTVDSKARQHAQALMETVGETLWIEQEPWMDIITALSGSGPAYFFYVMQCLIEGAQSLGLPADIANKLTLHTALGSAKLALHDNVSLEQLRLNVTSKGGTTELGIQILKDGKLDAIFEKALIGATQRGKDLSHDYD